MKRTKRTGRTPRRPARPPRPEPDPPAPCRAPTPRAPCLWNCRGRILQLGRHTCVMGIVNVTPDSFSDGGQCLGVRDAVERAQEMIRDGAQIIDVGGESTRPGAESVSPAEELRRILPVVEALVHATDAVISVDTRKAVVAEKALEAGAHIINDVSALTGDPGMAGVVERSGAGVVLMHMQGDPKTMQAEPRYGDVVAEVAAYLGQRVAVAVEAGIPRERVAVDPGIGFGKAFEHNLALLAHLDSLAAVGCPLLVGVSRKSFLGRITGRDVHDRLAASLGAAACAILAGAHIIRVHDVKESCDAARVADILRNEE